MKKVSIRDPDRILFNCSEKEYMTLYNQSINDPFSFWKNQSSKFISWIEPWSQLSQGSFRDLPVDWLSDGSLNITANCVDRHALANPDKIAILWEGNTPGEDLKISYQHLLEAVCRMANIIKGFGIKKGDVVCLYLPMIPEAIYAMLACARIGAIHNVVFGGFSAESLQKRILDSGAKLVITSNVAYRGNLVLPFKEIVDRALSNCPLVIENVLVIKRAEYPTNMEDKRDYWYHEYLTTASSACPPEPMKSNDPLFILYTSGSTGSPKGILHSCGGYALYTATTYYYLFNHHHQTIHWCTADIGWITGHSYLVYGPLLNGATIVVYEGVPNYPNFSRLWQIIDKYQVTNFYTAPTLIRTLRYEGEQWIANYKLTSLEILGSVGEPINPDVWLWFFKTIGKERCPIVNTWWQTEAGGVLLSAFPSDSYFVPGSVGKPFFGIKPLISNDNSFYIEKPWPGLMKTIYKAPERMKNGYFMEPEIGYKTGDSAYRDDEQALFIGGRIDDVIKVSGHRLSSEELESALIKHSAVAEAAVTGEPDDITGEKLIAFITPHKEVVITPELNASVINHLRLKIGPIATLKRICWVAGLPKTRSGKIMRRILKKIVLDQDNDLGDTSSLANPDIISIIVDAYKHR